MKDTVFSEIDVSKKERGSHRKPYSENGKLKQRQLAVGYLLVLKKPFLTAKTARITG